MMPRVLVAGAGPTGALCAHILRRELQQKIQIDVCDKSNGTGGRMSTSRDPGNADCTADLGAQYITVTPEYAQTHKRYHSELLQAGVFQIYTGGIEGIKSSRNPPGTNNYVTPQGISSIVKYFLKTSEADNVEFDHRLTSLDLLEKGSEAPLEVKFDQLSPTDPSGQSTTHPKYDAVILTMPVPQVLQLKGLVAEKLDQTPSIKSSLEKVQYSSRYALALFYPPGVTLDLPWKAKYEQEDECIRFISVDSKKRGNESACTALVVHTSVPFGIKYLETAKEEVEPLILNHLDKLVPNLPAPVRTKCQRWRYSQVSTPLEGSPGTLVLDEGPSHVLLVAGDGMSHSNLDGCIDSAEATCKRLIEHWKKTCHL
ncbi:Renalase [Holothuria leucospilota]|uniref:Renalase n=1 Tax=Holothuria leucospilota TaxID=206669 RepID=A0A9Q1BC94_HOLLE|nr:Renalase [Holothuria leucospilota]